MNIIEMAKQAGPLITTPFDQWCENFAALVRAQALEEVADMVSACDPRATPKGIAAAIRALNLQERLK